MEAKQNWQNCDAHFFWNEIVPCDHVVQIYETEEMFLDTLQEFTFCGIKSGDCVLIIGTQNHLIVLKERLQLKGLGIEALVSDDQLILLNAETTLAQFVKNGQPDKILFNSLVSELLARAKRKKRRLRAFGEMVAVLWTRGNNEATIQLEHMWNKFCETEAFCLFCAYPHSGFTKGDVSSIARVCQTHTKMISGKNKSESKIKYRNVFRKKKDS